MTIYHKIIWIPFFLQLVACGIIKEKTTVLVEDNNILSSSWIDIDPIDARVSLKSADQSVLQRRSYTNSENKIYYEALKLSNGIVMYAYFKESDRRPKNLINYIKNIFSNHPQFQNANMIWNIKSTKEINQSQKNRLAYSVMKGNKQSCFVFASDSNSNEKNYQLAIGSLCGDTNNKELNKFIQEKLEIAQSVYFDNGAHARNQLFSKVDKQLETLLIEQEAIERQGPKITLMRALRKEDTLWVEGNIKDDSGIDVVRFAGLLLEPLSENGNFVARLDGLDETTPMKIIAIDKYGNSSEVELIPELVENLPNINKKYHYRWNRKKGKYFALLISMEDYQNDSLDLDTPDNDVSLLHNTLNGAYDFDVEILKNPTLDGLRTRLQALSETLLPVDRLLIYYAGHGYLYPELTQQAPKVPQVSYWLLAETSLDAPDPKDWFSDQELRQWVARLPTRQVMVASDSCYSGHLVEDKVNYKSTSEGRFARTVMTSGNNQPVPDKIFGANSHFAIALDKTLQNLHNQDNLIGNHVYQQVKNEMEYNPLQEPQYGVLVKAAHDDGADFIFLD